MSFCAQAERRTEEPATEHAIAGERAPFWMAYRLQVKPQTGLGGGFGQAQGSANELIFWQGPKDLDRVIHDRLWNASNPIFSR